MKVIYVGDARDVLKRIIQNHCKGNVEGSALRKAVAEALGYSLKRSRRTSGSIRIRIDMSDPGEGEKRVSQYIRSGIWRYVFCDSYEEAHDFQWYVIDSLNPLLNRMSRNWNHGYLQRYKILFNQLKSAPTLNCNQMKIKTSGSGVYVLYHDKLPKNQNARSTRYLSNF